MTTGHGARHGLRERKKRATRAALSWAAIRLAVERGLANVRVDDIAAEVGVSTRTFNNYFSGKGDAVAAHQLDRTRRIASAVRERPAGEPLWESITGAVLAEFPPEDQTERAIAPDPEWVAGVRLMLDDPGLQGELFRVDAVAQEELAAAIAERTGTDAERDMYPQLAAGAVGAAVRAAIRTWLKSDPPAPIVPLLRDALERVSAGLAAP